MTLRRTLILSVLGLIALAGVIIGVVSTVALNGYLVNQLDSQLREASNRTLMYLTSQSQSSGPTPGFGPGQAAGTVAAVVADGTVVGGFVLDADGSASSLTDAELLSLDDLTASHTPSSLSIGDLGSYRVEVQQLTTTSGEVLFITGLPLADVQDTLRQQIIVIASVTVGVMVLAGVAGLLIIRLALRPLDRVTGTATRVAQLPLDRGDVALAERVPDTDERTEVGRVGLAFNRMLEHVADALTRRQRSENKVRQFVADASHELRTPLASIRGYAELTRRTAPDLPDDVAHSLGRIESEATRMTTLVEDLLLLARLDAKPELALAEVDLALVLVDVVSDAHVAGPDHDWEIDLPEEPVIVAGDPHRLHQVFANLLANARVHTPPGTHVTVSLADQTTDDGVRTAVVTVADDGPGIDPELQPILFERFVRGDGSRSRYAGSTGLGLAIVQAVVDAHGGAVSVASAKGSTVFRVAIPLAI